jgi:hypothetical protein
MSLEQHGTHIKEQKTDCGRMRWWLTKVLYASSPTYLNTNTPPEPPAPLYEYAAAQNGGLTETYTAKFGMTL